MGERHSGRHRSKEPVRHRPRKKLRVPLEPLDFNGWPPPYTFARCPAFDRPEIVLSPETIWPQRVGFIGQNGVEYQMDLRRAETMRLIDPGEVKRRRLTFEEALREQMTVRQDEPCDHCNVQCNARKAAKELSDVFVRLYTRPPDPLPKSV